MPADIYNLKLSSVNMGDANVNLGIYSGVGYSYVNHHLELDV